jgi:hypothetical protein
MRWKDTDKKIILVECFADDVMVRLAKQALEIQGASNLCGIAQAFARVMKEINACDQNKLGTEFASQHPIVHLWIDKFAHLAHYEQGPTIANFMHVSDLAEGKDVVFEITPFESDLGSLRKATVLIGEPVAA